MEKKKLLNLEKSKIGTWDMWPKTVNFLLRTSACDLRRLAPLLMHSGQQLWPAEGHDRSAYAVIAKWEDKRIPMIGRGHRR